MSSKTNLTAAASAATAAEDDQLEIAAASSTSTEGDTETPENKRKTTVSRNNIPSFLQLPSIRSGTLTRAESMAYPKASTSTLLSKIQYCLRQNSRACLVTVAFFAFLLIVSSDYVPADPAKRLRGTNLFPLPVSDHWGGAVAPGYFSVEDSIVAENQFRFAVVTDLDELSKITGEKKPTFKSIFLPGTLTRTEGNKRPYEISFERPRTLLTHHNEAGRGGEFSELTIFNKRLLTFDDRTGDVYEILNNEEGTDSYVVPRFVITEGSGNTDKGMKWEWSTVKNGELYMGSMGKEYTAKDGSISNRNNLWIAVLNGRGELRREDWTEKYNVVRKALKATWPGYLIMEAVLWSPALRKWVFLPRRISEEAYDENKDERKGGNKLVLVDESFSNAEVVEIRMDDLDPLKGFSSFAFVPGTGDRHALAIRSVEEGCVGGEENVCKQRSYFLVLDILSGEVLSQEVKYKDDLKFEGVEFVDMYKVPPK